jgi:DNA mismatch repair protein MutS
MDETGTPMLRQYRAIKTAHPDAILMFRLGDFYEMFYDDALAAARALSLTLTSRGRGTPHEAPMCGVPYHAAESYIGRLIRQGFRVAICDQVEDARVAKGIVRRAVTRVVSPGTVTEEAQLEGRAPNFIAALCASRGRDRSASEDGAPDAALGAAYLDLSTGDFRVAEHHGPRARAALLDQLVSFGPREILHPEGEDPASWLPREALEGTLRTAAPAWTFTRDAAYGTLLRRFGTASLDGFGCEGRDLAIAAAGALVQHLQETQKADLKHVTRLVSVETGDVMVLDAATLRTLEVVANARDGGRDGSLLEVLDRTATRMGARTLRDWLLRPLLAAGPIAERHEAVAFFLERPTERAALRDRLARIQDLERLLARCSLGTAGPRDLAGLRDSLEVLPEIAALGVAFTAPPVAALVAGLDALADLQERIRATLADEPPAALRDGGVVRDGFSPDLDGLRSIRRDGRATLAAIEARERERTGIASLKVRYNKIFGYYLEVSHANRGLVPSDYERRQTLVGAERYVTPELKEYEAKVLTAEERIAAIEQEIFAALRGAVADAAPRLRRTAAAVATLDVLAALAEAAAQGGYVRPRVEESGRLRIVEGRHPVVERLLAGERFVPNDAHLDPEERQILILTGPNMGGKSTYLRQVALIVLMAQAGSFVPAAEAEVGLVDRIFSRVGASDDLARGQSTFLVEMNETANILNNATRRSLVLLDEVGRGTSTFDGLSIAWSVAEYLHDTPAVAARTLFATHYHELTELALLKPRVRNLTLAVREWNDRIVFLRRVLEGAADRSYGIQVARLAGLPREVIERALEVLRNLEREELSRDGRPKLARHLPVRPPATPTATGEPSAETDGPSGPPPEPAQLGLFAPEEDPVVEALRRASIDGMTPLEALNLVARLKGLLGD